MVSFLKGIYVSSNVSSKKKIELVLLYEYCAFYKIGKDIKNSNLNDQKFSLCNLELKNYKEE